MLSDDVAEKGYALMCMAIPQTDVKIKVVKEVGRGTARDTYLFVVHYSGMYVTSWQILTATDASYIVR